MIRSCPRCSSAVQATSLARLSAEARPLALHVSGMPAVRCAKGHAMPIQRDFMLWLIQEIKARAGALPGGEARGLLLKKYFCACGKELSRKPDGQRAFPLELEFEGAPAFRAEMELPVFKCPACGKEQLRSAKEAQQHVAQAIVSLNDAAGFPHSG